MTTKKITLNHITKVEGHAEINFELFESWTQKKWTLEKNPNQFFFKRGEIWMSYIGINIGSEQNGSMQNFTRPVLILNKLNADLLIGLPLTTKTGNPKFRFPLENITFLKKESFVMLDQVRILDKKRLFRKMGQIPRKLLFEIRKKSAEIAFALPASEPHSDKSERVQC